MLTWGHSGDWPSWATPHSSASNQEVLVNPPHAHAALRAAFQRAQADALHKFGLIQRVANKGPKAIQAAMETAAKAAKRRDAYAKKLAELGVDCEE